MKELDASVKQKQSENEALLKLINKNKETENLAHEEYELLAQSELEWPQQSEKFYMPFCIVLTQDTKGNVIDAMYDDPDKKDKLMIATKKQFEIVGDVNLLIEDSASHDLQATACNSNMPHFQSSQEVVKNQSNEQMVDEFVDQFFLTQN